MPRNQHKRLPLPGHRLLEFSSLIIAELRWVQIPKTVKTSLALELSVAHNLGSLSEGTVMRETEHMCAQSLVAWPV